jgi:hypothetical protein
LVLALGDEFHLRRNDALARVVHLGHAAPGDRPARPAPKVEAQLGELRVFQPFSAVQGARAPPARRCRPGARSRARAARAAPRGCRSSPPGRYRARRCRKPGSADCPRSAQSRASARAAGRRAPCAIRETAAPPPRRRAPAWPGTWDWRSLRFLRRNYPHQVQRDSLTRRGKQRYPAQGPPRTEKVPQACGA